MKPIKLKQEAADMVIGYNNSAAPLGERKDLDKLLRMAYESNRQDYLDLFEERPDYAELVDEAYQNSAEIALPGISAPLPVLPELPPVVVPETPSAPVVVDEPAVLPEVPAEVESELPVMTGDQVAEAQIEADGIRAEARAEDAPPESNTQPATETLEAAKPTKKR